MVQEQEDLDIFYNGNLLMTPNVPSDLECIKEKQHIVRSGGGDR